MPLYEYQCHGCGKTFEVIQKFSDDPLSVHDECGGELERLISPAALQFKGSGWYVTDYARGRSQASGSTNGKQEAKTETTSESKPDTSTKTESKVETKSDKK